jgi:methyl-accepting chemotaxis protein
LLHWADDGDSGSGGVVGPQQALDIVLTVVLILLVGIVVYAVVELIRTLRSATVLLDDLDTRLVPLLDEAGHTVEALNTELERVDTVVTRMSAVSERVNAAEEAISVPFARVADLASRVRRVFTEPSRTG